MIVQGIGDEVVGVLIILFLVLLVSILWLSTHVQERPPVRAVVIRSANSETIAEFSAEPSPQPSSSANNEIQDAIEATAESIDQVSNQQNENEVTSEIRETTAEVTTETSSTTSTNDTVVETESSSSDTSTLATIKIRFINEDSLEIREKLTEKLGLFISKHLDRHLNLTNEDRVRLIYNGRVLGRDQTLAELGLTDNCVVHCLVQRSVGTIENSGTNNQNDNQSNNQNRLADDTMDLDLSSFCLPLLGALLMGIWWCQVVYSQYFNLTTTISLVSLTILFLATAVNSYLT